MVMDNVEKICRKIVHDLISDIPKSLDSKMGMSDNMAKTPFSKVTEPRQRKRKLDPDFEYDIDEKVEATPKKACISNGNHVNRFLKKPSTVEKEEGNEILVLSTKFQCDLCCRILDSSKRSKRKWNWCKMCRRNSFSPRELWVDLEKSVEEKVFQHIEERSKHLKVRLDRRPVLLWEQKKRLAEKESKANSDPPMIQLSTTEDAPIQLNGKDGNSDMAGSPKYRHQSEPEDGVEGAGSPQKAQLVPKAFEGDEFLELSIKSHPQRRQSEDERIQSDSEEVEVISISSDESVISDSDLTKNTNSYPLSKEASYTKIPDDPEIALLRSRLSKMNSTIVLASDPSDQRLPSVEVKTVPRDVANGDKQTHTMIKCEICRLAGKRVELKNVELFRKHLLHGHFEACAKATLKTIAKQDNLACPVCHIRGKKTTSIARHFFQFHTGINVSDFTHSNLIKIYKSCRERICPHCSRKFKSFENMFQHNTREHNNLLDTVLKEKGYGEIFSFVMSKSVCTPKPEDSQSKSSLIISKLATDPKPGDSNGRSLLISKLETIPNPEDSKCEGSLLISKPGATPNPEDDKSEGSLLISKPGATPNPEDNKSEGSLLISKPGATPNPEDNKSEGSLLISKPGATPNPEDDKSEGSLLISKPGATPNPEDDKSEGSLLISKPETTPKPEESKSKTKTITSDLRKIRKKPKDKEIEIVILDCGSNRLDLSNRTVVTHGMVSKMDISAKPKSSENEQTAGKNGPRREVLLECDLNQCQFRQRVLENAKEREFLLHLTKDHFANSIKSRAQKYNYHCTSCDVSFPYGNTNKMILHFGVKHNWSTDYYKKHKKRQLGDIQIDDGAVDNLACFDFQSLPEEKSKLILSAQKQMRDYKFGERQGQPFVQGHPCYSIDTRLSQCHACANVGPKDVYTEEGICQFESFRKLVFKNNRFQSAGFLDPGVDPTPADLELWLPPKSKEKMKDMDEDSAMFILKYIGKEFCKMVLDEENLKHDYLAHHPGRNIVWKRMQEKVREMCDVCSTTLFNHHFTCPECCVLICIDCYKTRKSQSIEYNAQSSMNNMYRSRKMVRNDRDSNMWPYCHGKKVEHDLNHLLLTQIVCNNSLVNLKNQIHAIYDQRNMDKDCICFSTRKDGGCRPAMSSPIQEQDDHVEVASLVQMNWNSAVMSSPISKENGPSKMLPSFQNSELDRISPQHVEESEAAKVSQGDHEPAETSSKTLLPVQVQSKSAEMSSILANISLPVPEKGRENNSICDEINKLSDDPEHWKQFKICPLCKTEFSQSATITIKKAHLTRHLLGNLEEKLNLCQTDTSFECKEQGCKAKMTFTSQFDLSLHYGSCHEDLLEMVQKESWKRSSIKNISLMVDKETVCRVCGQDFVKHMMGFPEKRSHMLIHFRPEISKLLVQKGNMLTCSLCSIAAKEEKSKKSHMINTHIAIYHGLLDKLYFKDQDEVEPLPNDRNEKEKEYSSVIMEQIDMVLRGYKFNPRDIYPSISESNKRKNCSDTLIAPTPLTKRLRLESKPTRCKDADLTKECFQFQSVMCKYPTASDEEVFSCHLCGLTSQSEAKVKQHICDHLRQINLEILPKESPFTCPKCNEEYTNFNVLLLHYYTHQDINIPKKPSTCPSARPKLTSNHSPIRTRKDYSKLEDEPGISSPPTDIKLNDFDALFDQEQEIETEISSQEFCRQIIKNLAKSLEDKGEDNEKITCEQVRFTTLTSKGCSIPHQWHCYGKLLLLEKPKLERNAEIFQDQWRRGQPVVVANSSSELNKDLWSPEAFLRDFGHEHHDLINCINGKVVPEVKLRKFWSGFMECGKRLRSQDGHVMLLKLKDWPPTEDIAEYMPDRFNDLVSAFPMPQYTLRGGRLNLAKYLPDYFLKPELGPKMYIAYGSALYSDKGSTNLHIDMSDAVNCLVYVGIPKDGDKTQNEVEVYKEIDKAGCDAVMKDRARKSAGEGKLPGALWHIFHPDDTGKIRDFLKEEALKKGKRLDPHDDPIHDQSTYLDENLRMKLYEKFGVLGYPIVQCMGDTVFIPAGAAHQVRNLHNCIKVAEDFVSPENTSHCLHLTQEFRHLTEWHTNHEDKLQIKNIIYHAVKVAAAVLQV